MSLAFRTLLLAAGIVLSVCPASGAAPVERRGGDGFHRGMTLGLFSDGNRQRYRRDLEELHALGVDSVSLHVAWGIPTIRSTEIGPRAHMTPSDARIRGAIRNAHGKGMRVLLFPLLFVDELEEGEWRGVLEPSDPEAFWSGYRAFLLRYARLAEEEGVEFLSLGSELCSLERDAARWRRLVRDVRGVYGGRITYSANWDHLDSVLAWADRLDLIGMNAYHEVGRSGDAPARMRDAWRDVRKEIDRWQERHGLPVLVTEIGYPSRSGGTASPWDYTETGEPDLAEQARGYRAFLEAWADADYLAGVYFYLWWGRGGPEDTGYTPRGKPAADVLKYWYQKR